MAAMMFNLFELCRNIRPARLSAVNPVNSSSFRGTEPVRQMRRVRTRSQALKANGRSRQKPSFHLVLLSSHRSMYCRFMMVYGLFSMESKGTMNPSTKEKFWNNFAKRRPSYALAVSQCLEWDQSWTSTYHLNFCFLLFLYFCQLQSGLVSSKRFGVHGFPSFFSHPNLGLHAGRQLLCQVRSQKRCSKGQTASHIGCALWVIGLILLRLYFDSLISLPFHFRNS